MAATLLSLSALFAATYAQQAGTSTTETHPKLSVQSCTKSGGCQTTQNSVVLDGNWRWLHSTSGYTNCYTGNKFDATLCPDNDSCAKNCALDGADYAKTYGITTSGDALTLQFKTGSNVGSRVYLMDADDKEYLMFKMSNSEFTFDVDVSKLPCGLNGALYFSQMYADGGLSEDSGNKAGAKYGTGYCDAQCPRDLKFIGGSGNVEGWTGSSNDANSGTGNSGTCCSEMDIWEANSIATAYTPHPCNVDKPYRCTEGTDCTTTCDQPGCDFNSWRMGNQTFYGPGFTGGIDTTKKFTVVTQFIAGSDGSLSEIRRKYVQNGVVMDNSVSTIAGVTGNSITDDFCAAQKTAFGDTNVFAQMGGMKQIGKALSSGMVLVMSIWDDHAANMLWLDSDYPTDADNTKPGVNRGSCATTSGVPADTEANSAGVQVIYSNIRYGDLDSTYGSTVTTADDGSGNNGASSTDSSPASAETTSSSSDSGSASSSTGTDSGSDSGSDSSSSGAASGSVAQYGQCGGTYYTGDTGCQSGFTCTQLNEYYSQCL